MEKEEKKALTEAISDSIAQEKLARVSGAMELKKMVEEAISKALQSKNYSIAERLIRAAQEINEVRQKIVDEAVESLKEEKKDIVVPGIAPGE